MVHIGGFKIAALGIGQIDEMDSLADLTIKMARHHLAAVDRKRSIVANCALDICRRLIEDWLD